MGPKGLKNSAAADANLSYTVSTQGGAACLQSSSRSPSALLSTQDAFMQY